MRTRLLVAAALSLGVDIRDAFQLAEERPGGVRLRAAGMGLRR
jgi:hypothetical protein